MPLVSIEDQTIIERYGELSQHGQEFGKPMLEFISMVNETFKETYLFGYTAHFDLCLNPVHTKERRDIIVSPLYNKNEKNVEYLISFDTFKFWKYRGCFFPEESKANSLSEAKKYLILAMSKNRSWSYSKELKQLLIDND